MLLCHPIQRLWAQPFLVVSKVFSHISLVKTAQSWEHKETEQTGRRPVMSSLSLEKSLRLESLVLEATVGQGRPGQRGPAVRLEPVPGHQQPGAWSVSARPESQPSPLRNENGRLSAASTRLGSRGKRTWGCEMCHRVQCTWHVEPVSGVGWAQVRRAGCRDQTAVV